MLRMRRVFRSRRAAAALLVQLAAISGLSVVEASHNHLDPHSVEWRGHTDEQPDGESANAQCFLCGHGGTCMSVANRAGAVHAPAVHGVRAHIQQSSRVVAVDGGFSTRPRAPPVT